jgi:hypothetical protein
MAKFFDDIIDRIKTELIADTWISSNIGTNNIYAYNRKAALPKFPCIIIALSDYDKDFESNVRWEYDLTCYIICGQQVWDVEKLTKGSASIIGIHEITDYTDVCLSKKSSMRLNDLVLTCKVIHGNFDSDEFQIADKSAFIDFSTLTLSINVTRTIQS